MKPFVLLLAASAVLVSACSVLPDDQSAEGFRDTVSRGNFFTSAKSFSVPRSVSAVNASLRNGAARCFNRTVEAEYVVRGGGFYNAVYSTQTRVIELESEFRNTSAGGELTVRYDQIQPKAMFGMPSSGVGMVVDTRSANGATAVTINGSRFGAGKTNQTIEAWARGQAAPCPDFWGTE